MSIDPTPITKEQQTKADLIVKWNHTLRTHVERIINANLDASQLELTRHIKEDLNNLFISFPAAYGLRVDPKGDKQVQIILTLDSRGEIPSVKIKQRYNVPSLIEEAA